MHISTKAYQHICAFLPRMETGEKKMSPELPSQQPQSPGRLKNEKADQMPLARQALTIWHYSKKREKESASSKTTNLSQQDAFIKQNCPFHD
ncbi:MAG: hypothetical protein AAFV95_28070 [Bacteroidota bacterium]